MGEILFENTTVIGDTLIRDMTGQAYQKMKLLRYALYAAAVVLLGVGVYDLLAGAFRLATFLGLSGPVIFIFIYRMGRRGHAAMLRRTLLERNPEGEMSFVFYEDEFGYADYEDELGRVEGKRSAYGKITKSVMLPATWIAFIGGAMVAVSLNGFTKGSVAEFKDFIQKKTRTEHK